MQSHYMPEEFQKAKEACDSRPYACLVVRLDNNSYYLRAWKTYVRQNLNARQPVVYSNDK